MTRPPRGRSILLTVCGLVAPAACAAWALAPLPDPDTLARCAAAPPAAPAEPPGAEPPGLDVAAFRAPLWLAPPPPAPKRVAAQAPPPPPPPPLRLQLVGIVVEEGVHRAVLYDPDTDLLHIARSGEPVGRCTVESVTSAEVTLRDGRGLKTLALRREDLKPSGAAP